MKLEMGLSYLNGFEFMRNGVEFGKREKNK